MELKTLEEKLSLAGIKDCLLSNREKKNQPRRGPEPPRMVGPQRIALDCLLPASPARLSYFSLQVKKNTLASLIIPGSGV